MGLAKRIDHVAIAVKDVDAAVQTFARRFGFPVERHGDLPALNIRRAHLRIGDATLELFTPKSEESPPAKFLATRGEGMYLLSLEVENLAAAVKVLETKGIGVRVERLADGMQLGFISPKDTHGVLLQLIELPQAR